MPEAGLEFCEYFDPHDLDQARDLTEKLIFEPGFREARERFIAECYSPIPWRTIAEKIIAGSLESKPAPARSLQPMEYVFKSPCASREQDPLCKILSFEKGFLSAGRLGWDNYALAQEIVCAGHFRQNGEHGIITEDGWLEIRIRLAQLPASPALLMAPESGDEPLIIDISRFGALLAQEKISGQGIIHPEADRLCKDDEISFRLASAAGSPFSLCAIWPCARSEISYR